MKTLKSIDGKSFLIGGLLASTFFFAMGATSKTDAGKWDDKQEWETQRLRTTFNAKEVKAPQGWEPIGHDEGAVVYRKRIK